MRTLFAISFLIDISLALMTSDQYLRHYWPICNNQMSDHIGSAHMTLGSGVSYTMDRFGIQFEALALNNGWTHVPRGIYFDRHEFTIAAWIWPQNIGA